MSSPLPSQQIQTCLVCNKQPLPESAQYGFFMIFEVLCVFFSIRLALVALLVGWYFSKIIWKCPMCKRQILLSKQDPSLHQNLIIRAGNCFLMLSKQKYAIVASVLGVYLLYGFFISTQERMAQAKFQVRYQQTWDSLLRDCGTMALIDNEVHAKRLFSETYGAMSPWNLEGVFMRTVQLVPSGDLVFEIKMQPTQHPDVSKPDLLVYPPFDSRNLQLQSGALLKFSGEFYELRSEGLFVFSANTLEHLNEKVAIENIKVYEPLAAFGNNLRNHQT